MPITIHRPTPSAASLAMIALAALAACNGGDRTAADSTAGGGPTAAAPPATAKPCAPDNAGLTLASGFCAAVYADSLGGPRHVAVGDDGTVYVVRLTVPKGDSGGVVALRDTTGDGRADVRVSFGPEGGTGVGLHGGDLYVDAKTAILRYHLAADHMHPAGAPDTIVRGLPTGGHEARNFTFDGSGALYVNVGSPSNACQQKDRAKGSPGKDPCTELDTRAGVWKFDANRTGQTQATGDHFASGIRNGMGLAFASDGQLWATQHGRDQLYQNWPAHYTAELSAQNPAEELMRVNSGDDFGWPYCYYDFRAKRLVLAPEYGGDGTQIGRCADKKEPVAVFPGHWAPMSMLFYKGSQLPARYKNGVFIAFHGSWNRAPEPQAGYRVVFQPLNGDSTGGQYEDVATGFPGGTVSPSGAEHRPVGLAQTPDGSILVTDDKGGRIYRISYTGAGAD